MATFGPPLRDNASNFNDVYENTSSRFGIQNARSAGSKNTLTSRPSEGGRVHKQKVRYQGPSEVIDFEQEKTRREQIIADRYYAANQEQIDATANTNASPTKKKVAVSLVTKNIATAFLIITNSWALVVWSFVQFWAGLISSLFFGLTAAVTYSYIGDVISSVATWFGYTEPDLMSLGFWGLVTAAAVGWISLLIAAMHAKLVTLHPLMGRGKGLKTGTFILAVVLYAIPLLNMIPWIMFWAWTVKIYPK